MDAGAEAGADAAAGAGLDAPPPSSSRTPAWVIGARSWKLVARVMRRRGVVVRGMGIMKKAFNSATLREK